MSVKYFDKLIDNYIPTDAGWFYHPDNAVPLETTVDENGNLVSDGDVSLLGGNVPFEQIGFTTVGDGINNQKVYYLSVISADAGAVPMSIITDLGASNAKALKITGPCTMLFKTAYPYNKDTLKKVTVRLKSTVAGDIRVGLAGMQDEAYFSPTGAYAFDSFYEIAVSASNVPYIDGAYHTIVGYFKETSATPTTTYPTPYPDHPCTLLTGTTDIAMAIKCTSGTFLIDSIDVQENIGSLFEVPGGQVVLDTLSDLADDNKITPAEKTYIETQWNAITHEYGDETTTGLYFNAVTSGINPITLANYKKAYGDLYTYLYGSPDGIMLVVSITSDIDPVIYGSMFSDYFTTKASLNDEYNSIVYALSLTASSYIISIYRGVYSVNTIVLTLTTEHITAPSVLWTCSDGTLTKVDDSHYTLDCTTVVGDQAMIEVSGVGGEDEYTYTLGIAKVIVASTPYNFGGVTEVPTLTPTNAEPIVEGDYFLWASPTQYDSVSFNEATTYIDLVAHASSFALTAGQPFELEATVQTTASTLNQTVMDIVSSDGSYILFNLYETIEFQIYDNITLANTFLFGTIPVTDGLAHTIKVSYDGINLEAFVDGVSDGIVALATYTAYATFTSILIGARYGSIGSLISHFSGKINDIKFSKSSVLIAEYLLGVGFGAIATDSVGANDGTIYGGEYVHLLTKGAIYEYNGTMWVESTNGDLVMTMFDSFADLANDVDSTVTGLAVIKKLVAIEAFIEALGAKIITVTEEGSISTEDFTEDSEGVPQSGFMLDNPITPTGRRGRIRSDSGIFNNATIYGTIIHPALFTRESAPTASVIFPSKTAWNRKTFWNSLAITENTANMVSTNINIAGTTYAYLRKITSATFEKLIFAYTKVYVYAQSFGWDQIDTYYTSFGKGQIRVNAQTYSESWDETQDGYYWNDASPSEYVYGSYTVSVFWQTQIEVYVDGVLKWTSAGNSGLKETLIAVNKGSSIKVRVRGDNSSQYSQSTYAWYGINWRGIQNSLQYSNSSTSWDTIENMATDYLVRGRWYCSSPVAFDSNNYLLYALANAFIAGFTKLPIGVTVQADSAVSRLTYGSLSNVVITSIINYGSSIRLIHYGGYVTFTAGVNADGSFTGWYNAGASVAPFSKEGIVVSNIIPKDTSREVGEYDNPFKTGYFTELAVTGVVSAGTVYGAVGNDIVDNIEAPAGWEIGKAYIVDNNYYGIASDTGSIHAGVSGDDKMPRAVAGFVLVCIDKEYKVNTKLTYRKDGSLTKKHFWDRKPVIATYYMTPKETTWNNVDVDGRCIVKVVM